jgi:hydrogenase expression/formation protein HypC
MCLAVPGKIVRIMDDAEPHLKRGKVDFGGVQKEICLAYTPEAEIGDYVLVHVGFSLSRIDEEEAQKIFEILREMGDLAELEAGEKTS